MLRHIVMWKFRPGTETERELFLTGLLGGSEPDEKTMAEINDLIERARQEGGR